MSTEIHKKVKELYPEIKETDFMVFDHLDGKGPVLEKFNDKKYEVKPEIEQMLNKKKQKERRTLNNE